MGHSKRIKLLDRYFFNRRDQAAALMGWGKPHPIIIEGSLPGLLRAHVMGEASPSQGVARYETKRGALKVESGHFRLGSYTPDLEGNTRWLCIDLDGPGHSDALVDPEGAARATHAAFIAAKIPAHIEQSGGGKGWHIWVFFDEPIPAKLARRLARTLVPDDFRLVRGGVAVPRRNRGVEIFPKVDRLKDASRLGNLVWLPWFHGAPEGSNQFYREDGNKLVPYDPDDFETVTLIAIEEALEVEGAADPEEAVVEKFLRSPTKQDDSQRPPSSRWREWKEKALAGLPLERIYGDLLTGEAGGEGWLRCRDPDSPSGSESRSGNVADGNGIALRGTYRSWRTEECFSVFDFMVQRGRAKNFIDAARQVAEMTGVPLPNPSPAPGTAPPPGRRGKPVIVAHQRQLDDIIREARGVLDAANARPAPVVYRHAGGVAHLASTDGKPEITRLDDVGMYGVLARVADWVRRTEEEDIPVFPPRDVANDLVKFPPSSLPAIEQVVTSPTFDAMGRLIEQPGYDRASGVWYHCPKNFTIAAIPLSPSSEDIAKAKAILLDDLLVDFPFEMPSDLAHALAALLLPFVRRMIDGPTPIHLIEAPVVGSGKTLIGEVVCILATGDKAEPTTLPKESEEIRKKLLSLLMTSPQVVLLDNVAAGIADANLAAVITAEKYKDRILGATAMGCPVNRTVWLVSSNNPSMSLEIARRSVRIRIDAVQERPWERQNFKHSPLKRWTMEHRGELVHAILTLVQAWIAKGCPSGTRTLGSFEVWAAVIGGILDTIGVSGFLENTLDMYEAADVESYDWRAFVVEWWNEHGGTPVPAKTLMELATTHELLSFVLSGKTERAQSIRLGKGLMSNRNRVFGDFRIVAARVTHNQRMWELVRVGDSASDEAEDFGGDDGTSKRGMLLPFQRDIPPTSPPLSPASNKAEGDVGDVGDVALPFAGTREEENNRKSLAHTRGGVRDNIPPHPHIPQTQQNSGSEEGDVGGDVQSHIPLTSPSTSEDLDLAHIDDGDKEKTDE